MDVRAVVADVYGVRLDAAVLQHIAQAYPGPLRAAHCTGGPLSAMGRRIELAATIPCAFQHHLHGVVSELFLQFFEREGHGLRAAFTGNLQRPFLGRERLRGRGDAIVADEKMLRGRDGIIKQMGGSLGEHRTIIEEGQTLLAGDLQWLRALRHCHRDKPRRHLVSKNNLCADSGAHGSNAQAFEKTAATDGRGREGSSAVIHRGQSLGLELVRGGLRIGALSLGCHGKKNTPQGVGFYTNIKP